MNLKTHEIILAALAILVPMAVLVVGMIPGGFGFIYDLALDPVRGPIVFFGGAAVLFGVLAWRIYRRIRPAAKKAPEPTTAHVSPAKMPRVEGSAAIERLKNTKP